MVARQWAHPAVLWRGNHRELNTIHMPRQLAGYRFVETK